MFYPELNGLGWIDFHVNILVPKLNRRKAGPFFTPALFTPTRRSIQE
jgi:hypothetical protein